VNILEIFNSVLITCIATLRVIINIIFGLVFFKLKLVVWVLKKITKCSHKESY